MIQELLAGPFGPILIFFLRITDVSMATVRMLLIVRGAKVVASLIGFFEVSIWIFAVASVVQHLTSPWHLVGYAAGFATGNYVGMLIEERLALGVATIQTIVRSGAEVLAEALRGRGFAVTEVDGRGKEGPVTLLYSAIARRRLDAYVAEVQRDNPDAFLIVEAPRAVMRGWMFPMRKK
ncbi:MAG: DUF5698 domain-containing protein [Gemmatimonadota bacterium]|jgi:uncharacterized protein YebE (UPF0316 family)